MILDSIILENFGAYGGRNEAILTPDNEKPIILFGGMNGGGKTTLLDAIQLAFYGSKARISNRGKLSYKEFLKESIHRGSAPEEGASITLRFHRMLEGKARYFELQRRWRQGVKGIIESINLLRDGMLDNSEHWDEDIEAYLPSSIAHLFFFDGEQIKDLAEGDQAAEILGTAIHSLLGLDLVDRLESDLKVFERRKKAEVSDEEAIKAFQQVRSEVEQIDCEQEKVAMEEGVLVNETGRLGKELRTKEDLFRKEGGNTYLQRNELENELTELKTQKKAIEMEYRELVAGPLPLLFAKELLSECERLARHETEVRRARILIQALESRDQEVVAALKTENIGADAVNKILQILETDRRGRIGLSEEPIILDPDDTLAPQLAHLQGYILPATEQQSQDFIAKLAVLDEKIIRLESEISRVPTAERIEVIIKDLEDIRSKHKAKLDELEALRVRQQVLQRQRVVAETKLDKLGERELDARYVDDDRKRILKHSHRVRTTLGHFRSKVINRHTTSMELLILESFRKLLHKKDLISGLKINPETFETTLTGRDGKDLPFDRLSAGERQLLATSLLWGLARASGRPVPTIIDTPLGRLDSSHRRHLIERYFPCASHQVLLLSTDEEIVGSYYKALKPYITRTYILSHDETSGNTQIKPGYFSDIKTYETAH